MANVTIIVPIYNAEKYLAETLDSILAQTYHDWVCLLVNDGSTDYSQNIIEEYCKIDIRFRGLQKENEKTVDFTRRYALQHVSTEWVINIDADDYVEPLYLEKLVRRQSETGADAVVPQLIGCVNELEGNSYYTPLQSFDKSQVISGKDACLMTLGGWGISANVMLYRRKLAKDEYFGPYMNSDEYSQRLIVYQAAKVVFSDAEYRYRNNIGTSRKVSVRMFDRTLVDMQLEQFVYENFPDRDDKIKALAWQRLFNLIYLTADYHIHKYEFSKDEQEKAQAILRRSYKALNRKTARTVAPVQALMLTHSFPLFSVLATLYVRYKRSRGGKFYYR